MIPPSWISLQPSKQDAEERTLNFFPYINAVSQRRHASKLLYYREGAACQPDFDLDSMLDMR